MKLKNSNCDKTQKLKLRWNSKTQIVIKLKTQIWINVKAQIFMIIKISNPAKTKKLKFGWKLINSNCDKNKNSNCD